MGKARFVSAETLRALLKAIGVPAETPDQLQQAWRDAQRSRLCVPPVIVVWGQTAQRIRVCGSEPGRAHPVSGRIQLEDGSKTSVKLVPSQAHGLPGTEANLPVLPYGYHHLELQSRETTSRSLVICAPKK